MSKDANSFGHDKALAWESRGFVYTKRGCIVSTHPLCVELCLMGLTPWAFGKVM